MNSNSSLRVGRSLSHLKTRFTASVFGRGAVSFFFASAGVNASNFLFHIIVSRLLGPAQYGIAGALLNVTALVTVPLGAIQLYVTHHVATHDGHLDDQHFQRTLRATLVSAGAATLVLSSLAPVLDRYLHSPSPLPIVLIALWIPSAAASAVLQGVLIGKFEFRSVAWITFVGGGPVRLIGGALLVELGLGVSGVLLATLVSQVFIVVALWFAVQRHRRTVLGHGESAPPKNLILTAVALTGFTTLTGLDSFLARHYLSAHGAGLYVAGAVAAHIALFAPGAISTIVFPHLAQTSGDESPSRRPFYQALLAVIVTEVIVCSLLIVFAHPVIELLFGSQFLGATSVLAPLALASGLLGIAGLFLYYLIAQSSKVSGGAWVGVALLAILVVANHHSDVAVAWSVVIACALTLAVLLIGASTSLVTTSPFRGEIFEYEDLPPATLDLTIVTPFYNPGHQLEAHVSNLLEVLATLEVTYEVIAVSDGATDGSDAYIEKILSPHLRLVRLPRNMGKGAALRVGLLQGRGRYIAFIDADGDIPASILDRYVTVMNNTNPDILYASKRHPGSEVVYPPLRRIYSWTYQQLITVLFQLPIRDTQTGLKFIRRDVVAQVLPRMLEKRFAFDLELFVVAKSNGFSNFVELPVVIRERFASTVSLHSAYRLLLDTVAIFYRSRILKFYGNSRNRHASLRATTSDQSSALGRGLDQKLRILVFNWRDLAHPKAGGAEVYTHRIAEAWVKQGHSVTIFCASVEGRPGRETCNGVNIVRRGGRHSVYTEAKQFWKTEGVGNFDLVIDEVNTRPFGTPKWVKDVPSVALIHQVCRELWFYQLPLPIALVGRFILEPWWLRAYHNTPVLTISASSAESLRQYGITNTTVIPVGHDFDAAVPNVAKEKVPTIIFVGRLERHKRPEDVVLAFRALTEVRPEAQLWIIGSGPLEKNIRESSVGSIKIFGSLSDQNKLEYMARAHVLVTTSVREGWGLVVSESAYVGTMSIGYDVPGLRDSISAAGGTLTAASPDALAATLISLFQSEVNYVRNFEEIGVRSWSDVASRFLESAQMGVATLPK